MKPSYQRFIQVNETRFLCCDFPQKLLDKGIQPETLPFSLRILAENILRNMDGINLTETHFERICHWQAAAASGEELPWYPARVLVQDFTGVPLVADLAAIRDAAARTGTAAKQIHPKVPVDLVVDHSVQVDYFGIRRAVDQNVDLEYKRNRERYGVLKWAQESFDGFRVVPPGAGICHQVNLEFLSQVVMQKNVDDELLLFPDTLVGCDSHTPMINGIGVLGWGVGGIEAEAVVLGRPYPMTVPEIIGVRLTGSLTGQATGTDLVLTLTQMLRKENVVGKFLEFYGEGTRCLSLPDRATIANMSPEFGATVSYFPVDEETLRYLRDTDRKKAAEITEAYCRSVGLFYDGSKDPVYSRVLELDLTSVIPCVAGPSRPQDRIALSDVATRFQERHKTKQATAGVPVITEKTSHTITDGAVVIAAITSCTNTSNPFAMIGAGMLARNAVASGLTVPPWVKTSLAPGSRVVTEYLHAANLLPYLEALGFHVAGYGCTTCIGNSGPLPPATEAAIRKENLSVAAVLSGNRNFEARVHQLVRENYLASPMLVVAYALAGHLKTDLTTDPIGHDPNGQPVYLRDIWPEHDAIREMVKRHVQSSFFPKTYQTIFAGDALWNAMEIAPSTTFRWDAASTYLKRPPFPELTSDHQDILSARPLLLLGDSVTTDHISPAGEIPPDSPAGQYLQSQGVTPDAFNSYGARRGNHEVMMRGTFANIRIKNKMVAPKEGGYTKLMPEATPMSVYGAAMAYRKEGIPLVVIAGAEYGTGSSRDWAAKGTRLLGVRAVIAASYERIHRSNLIGMGVLPLEFLPGENADTIGIDGTQTFTIKGIASLTPKASLTVHVRHTTGEEIRFTVLVRLDTPTELGLYQAGGILPAVLQDFS